MSDCTCQYYGGEHDVRRVIDDKCSLHGTAELKSLVLEAISELVNEEGCTLQEIYDTIPKKYSDYQTRRMLWELVDEGSVTFTGSWRINVPTQKLDSYVCPCTVADVPCSEDCTCISRLSSRGCMCCATYGSEEQRKTMANMIVECLKAHLWKFDPDYRKRLREQINEELRKENEEHLRRMESI